MKKNQLLEKRIASLEKTVSDLQIKTFRGTCGTETYSDLPKLVKKDTEFVITPGQIESLELENNELKILVENLKAEKEIILRGSPDNRKITDVKLPLAGEDLFYITKQQIKIIQDSRELEEVKYITKEWFPEVFELPKDFTGWVKDDKYPNVIAYSEKGYLKFGFDANCNWVESTSTKLRTEREATEAEVFEALKNEAVKRGFVDGAYYQWVNCPIKKVSGNYFVLMDDVFRINGFSIMDNTGSWATIIPTITKEQAEKELGKKII